jgi:putative oxidoreductase
MTNLSQTETRGAGTAGLLGHPAVRWVFGAGYVDRASAPAAWAMSAVLLAARLWLALPFFKAGMARVEAWDRQAMLFEWVHPVPFLPPATAALVTTLGELTLSITLVLGLLGRLSALGLAIMAATIFFIVGRTPEGMENGIAIAAEQLPWMLVGLALFIIGPGRIALDEAIRRWVLK